MKDDKKYIKIECTNLRCDWCSEYTSSLQTSNDTFGESLICPLCYRDRAKINKKELKGRS